MRSALSHIAFAEHYFYEWIRARAGTSIVMGERSLNPVSKMNYRVMFGKDEKEWREYKCCSEEKKRNGASILDNDGVTSFCLHIGFFPTFLW